VFANCMQPRPGRWGRVRPEEVEFSRDGSRNEHDIGSAGTAWIRPGTGTDTHRPGALTVFDALNVGMDRQTPAARALSMSRTVSLAECRSLAMRRMVCYQTENDGPDHR